MRERMSACAFRYVPIRGKVAMPKTIQIRDMDDEVHRVLSSRAAAAGMSLPELPRREAQRLAARPSIEEWFERFGGRLDITAEQTRTALDDVRGPWPDGSSSRC